MNNIIRVIVSQNMRYGDVNTKSRKMSFIFLYVQFRNYLTISHISATIAYLRFSAIVEIWAF